jgi:hypothetical protein
MLFLLFLQSQSRQIILERSRTGGRDGYQRGRANDSSSYRGEVLPQRQQDEAQEMQPEHRHVIDKRRGGRESDASRLQRSAVSIRIVAQRRTGRGSPRIRNGQSYETLVKVARTVGRGPGNAHRRMDLCPTKWNGASSCRSSPSSRWWARLAAGQSRCESEAPLQSLYAISYTKARHEPRSHNGHA